jgi:UDP-N-acetylglucosamine 4,6-dehydratase|tara:strand:- start:631 stop:1635 length:1005 start_codon:yes stop_codon:yes gene_type:complete
MFKDKTLLITGGSGSFGKAILDRFTTSDLKEIRIFSRDEKKQDDLRKKYNNPKIKFYIGDVRDFDAVLNATRGSDFIFHAAALKQVPSCEFYPLEAVKTNILGTENVLEASVISKVKKVICLSTDKAVYPINAMGISKSMMEKVALARSRFTSDTEICITRYGNVMGSRGSVIPLMVEQIKSKVPITITDPNMTRFIMSLNEAVDLVLYAFTDGRNGEILVQKSPACSVGTLAMAIKNILDAKNAESKIIGTRHGEKQYEVLLSREEMHIANEFKEYFSVPLDNRDLNYDSYFEIGDESVSSVQDFNSNNTDQLNVKGVENILNLDPNLNYLFS